MTTRYKKEPKGNSAAKIATCYHKGSYKNIQKRAIFVTVFFCIYALTSIRAYGQQTSAATVTPFNVPPGGGGPPKLGAISGPISVTPGQTAQYSVSIISSGGGGGSQQPAKVNVNSNSGTTYYWNLDNSTAGTITGSNPISITWSSGYTGSTNINCAFKNSNGYSNTVSLLVTITAPPLVCGSISPANQTINYNTTPTTLTCSSPSGGLGGYTYQWYNQRPSIGGAGWFWNPIQGATGLSYNPGSLTSTQSYELVVTSHGVSATSSTAVINVNPPPPISPGSITPASQTISYNTVPGTLTSSIPSGGTGNYNYTWQFSTDGGKTFNNITGAPNAPSYTPGTALTTTTYYQVVYSSTTGNVPGVAGTPVVVNVNPPPPISPGSITPASQTINYNTVPGTLTSSIPSGGTGSYNYAWQSSTDGGKTFNNITGAPNLPSYTPLALTATTSFEVVYSSTTGNVPSVTSTPVVVNVTPSPPSISYTGTSSPLTFIINKPISTISPNNTGSPIPSTISYGTVGTPIGTGAPGSTNGSASIASFNYLTAVAADSKGNIYVADSRNNQIRKIDHLTGNVSLFAGSSSGVAGYADCTKGKATTIALFDEPLGVAVDSKDNIYVADYLNFMIRKIAQDGTVSTFATGFGGTYGGPYTMALDISDNVYVADSGNLQIVKVSQTGVKTVLGGGAAAGFAYPVGVAVDKQGNVYVADRDANQIKMIDQTKTGAASVSVFAGTGVKTSTDGTATTATFNWPSGVATDASGNVYVTDGGSGLIRVIGQNKLVYTVAGTGIAGTTVGFNDPQGLCLDGMGNLYLADFFNQQVRKVAITGYTVYPALPQGLSLDSKTGIISGTPTASSLATVYTITGYNASGSNAITLTLGVNPGLPLNLSKSQNYVVTYQPRIPGITDNNSLAIAENNRNQVQTTVQYFDGLGSPIQTVQYQASPTGNDIVLPQTYDPFGREGVKFLPYALTSQTASDGSYKPTAMTSGGAQSLFYTTPPNGVPVITMPMAVTGFEMSPLNRVVEQGSPGAAWQFQGLGDPGSSNHTGRSLITINDQSSTFSSSYTPGIINNGSQIAALYTATINSDETRTLVRVNNNATYLPGQLSISIIRDENWQPSSGCLNSTEEYKDKEGHLVLKRTYNLNNNNPASPFIEMLSTYYVYDDYGNLAFVLTPMANPDGTGAAIAQSTLDNLCYQYRYDQKNRLTQKKLPGKGWEFMVYNQINQVVITQDANQRGQSIQQTSFIKYDSQGRTIMTGQVAVPTNPAGDNNISTPNQAYRQSLESYYNSTTKPLWESVVNSSNTGYSNAADPIIPNNAYYTINYYDNYGNAPSIPNNIYGAPAGATGTMTRGLLIASKTMVINTLNNTKPDMLWSEMYYDNLGRNIQSYKQHYLGGSLKLSPNNYDCISTTYDFTNAPITVTRKHYTSASTTAPSVTIANTYTYDQVGRKLQTWEQITNGTGAPTTNTLLSQMVYNEVGQVWNKQLHSTDGVNFAQTIGYTYNERGWLLGSSAPLFAMQLQYNTGTNKQYNGNIAYQNWQTLNQTTNSYSNNTYTYTYDNLNRLKAGTSTDNYNETGITYDLMGNITALNRTKAGTLIDQLSYTYASGTNATNQLQSINDASGNAAGLKAGISNFTYDNNGNLITDPTKGTKGINIAYNLLNLPQSITGSKSITYIYDAAGNKLRRVSTATNNTDYISGIQYDGGNTATNPQTLTFIQTEEGKAVPSGSNYDYVYYMGDNLGNTRVTFDVQNNVATALQQDDYFPFGYEISRLANGTKNEYLYNKKELQEELTQYDYGARFYDPLIARWNTIDPKAEQGRRLSPYNYAFDNPMRFTDPDGMWPDWGALVQKAKDFVIKKAEQAVVNITNAAIASVKDKLKTLEPSVYIKANAKVTGTVGGSADIKGVGVHGAVNSRDLLSITVGGKMNTASGKVTNESTVDYANKNGENKYAQGAGAEFIVGGDYNKEKTVNGNGEVTKIATDKSISVGYPGVGALQNTITNENGNTGFNGGYTNGASVGVFLNFSVKFSVGVQLKPKEE